MAKPEAWRLEASVYPIMLESQTRFQDMDFNSHLNNVAYAALFENARVMMHKAIKLFEASTTNERTMVASLSINYLREGNFPDSVWIGSGIGRIGNSSWTIFQGMFQNELCIATCDSVIVCRTNGEAAPLREEVITGLSSILVQPI